MNASKENAAAALSSLLAIADKLSREFKTENSYHFIKLEEFLNAAHRKLPREESFQKEKSRKS